jgi:hypothetical protein
LRERQIGEIRKSPKEKSVRKRGFASEREEREGDMLLWVCRQGREKKEKKMERRGQVTGREKERERERERERDVSDLMGIKEERER